jgi:hypothetical protein
MTLFLRSAAQYFFEGKKGKLNRKKIRRELVLGFFAEESSDLFFGEVARI